MTYQINFAERAKSIASSEIRELLKLLEDPEIISFAGGIPDPTLFPKAQFAEAFNRCMADNLSETGLQYSVSEGYQPLRALLVDEMHKLGIECGIDNILITTGSQQALDALGKLFIGKGDLIRVAKPTYMGALQAFRAYVPEIDELILDCEHPDYEAQCLASKRTKLLYSSVDFANPTGESLTVRERLAALKLARANHAVIIEDAAYQALRYDGRAQAPILAMELNDIGDINQARTIYCGSFSKTLSPGLRVGWVCAAKPIIDKLTYIKQAADLHSPTLNQMAIYDVASSGFQQHIGTLQAAYRRKRDCMLKALDTHMPDGVCWTKPEGGMFIWAALPQNLDAGSLLKTAVNQHKIAYVPGSAFHFDGSGKHTLRLNFSHPTEADITCGIGKLGHVIAQEMASLDKRTDDGT